MKFEIKSHITGKILFSVDTESWKLAVETAVKSGTNLSGANLSRADLYGANLSGANLSRADLYEADLSKADLYGANLSRADLSKADLSKADLSKADLYGADLSKADLSGANLYEADLSNADLSRANLTGANLYRAHLYEANLSKADLYEADLYGANLSGANLSGADLSGANLYGAKDVDKNLSTPLRILLEQLGPIRAYKLVNAKGEGPFNGGINYLLGDHFAVDTFNADEGSLCGAGINLATLDWVMREWKPGFRILIMEFFAEGNLCIPTATDGKFRVKTCRRVGEKDLKELGLN